MKRRPTHAFAVPSALTIRTATASDVDALVAIENASFSEDRISRRQFRHLLTRANAAVLVAEDPRGGILGDVVLLFSRGTATARLYSVATAPSARAQGVGRLLVEAAQAEAWRRERPWMRLEVRKDNIASMRLFESLGYRRFGEHPDYYPDHMDAWRYEKAIDQRLKPILARVPYYRQTLEFTCGPAALMMAMKALAPGVEMNRGLELRLWREATTIFMTSGHGGCGPFGLALAAHRRGFTVQVFVSDPGIQMIDSVRNAEKKEVMALVQADMAAEIAERGIPVHYRGLGVAELEERFHSGDVPVVLISSWQIYEEKAPHWVVVTGFDQHFVYMHDPYVDEEEGEVSADSINMPIGREQFDRMVRYGRRALQSVVLVSAPGSPVRQAERDAACPSTSC